LRDAFYNGFYKNKQHLNSSMEKPAKKGGHKKKIKQVPGDAGPPPHFPKSIAGSAVEVAKRISGRVAGDFPF